MSSTARHEFICKATAAQSDGVDADVAEGFARHLDERRDVLADKRAPCHKGVLSDSHELLDGHHPFDDDPILDGHMAGNAGAVGQDAVVSHHGIVGNVGVGHQQAVNPREWSSGPSCPG